MNINKKIKTKEDAKQYAIDWQKWNSEKSLSYRELVEWNNVFEELISLYPDLKEEFKDNAIL